MPGNTIRLHRVLRCKPEKVYRAFTEADAFARWIPPHGYTCQIDTFEPRVGGRHHMAFRNFTTGNSHSFGGEFLELVPGQRLRYTDKFDDPNMSEVMEVTVELRAVACGTELNVTQAGVPEMIPPEMCYAGWQESLEYLARLVEPEINEG